jgi:hypothetical protein
MKKFFLLLLCCLLIQSCDIRYSEAIYKLIIVNNSENELEVLLSDNDKYVKDALFIGFIKPRDTSLRLGVTNTEWDYLFKKNKYTKLYIIRLYKENDTLKNDTSKILKIIYLKKDSLDAIGWKMEYP